MHISGVRYMQHLLRTRWSLLQNQTTQNSCLIFTKHKNKLQAGGSFYFLMQSNITNFYISLFKPVNYQSELVLVISNFRANFFMNPLNIFNTFLLSLLLYINGMSVTHHSAKVLTQQLLFSSIQTWIKTSTCIIRMNGRLNCAKPEFIHVRMFANILWCI